MEKTENFVGKSIKVLLEYSGFLLIGALAALFWANFDPEGYHHIVHFPLWESEWFGIAHGDHKVVTVHFLVNDILMALFFAMAGKEIREAMLPGGSLHSPKQAMVPLIATLGGMLGPIFVFITGAHILGVWGDVSNGWAIPTATDIAFSYLVARLIWPNLANGKTHPAISFLLLLAIADDAGGLIILAIFYPQQEMQMMWMALPVLAIVAGLILKRLRVHSFWLYLVPLGIISWVGFAMAGIHPALSLVPLMWVLPHAQEDEGIFNWSELNKHDSLNEFEHWWKNPVEIILFGFGFLNAGVVVSSVGSATWLVLSSLFLGKVMGISILGLIAARFLGNSKGPSSRDIVAVSMVAGIGFTVAIFVSSIAFSAGPIQDAAKFGALLSLFVGLPAYFTAKMLKVGKFSNS